MKNALYLAIVLTSAAYLPAGQSPGQARAPGPDAIRVPILDLHSNRGTVYCSIYAAPGDGFPGDAKKARGAAQGKIEKNRSFCYFRGLPPGVYAVGMIHDENDNQKFDTNWLGLPAEGYGASRDAKPFFGPPRFKDAAFSYGGGSVDVPIHVRY